MSGFFGAGVIPGGVVLGNLLGKGGQFGPILAPPVTPVTPFVFQFVTVGGPSSNGPYAGTFWGSGSWSTGAPMGDVLGSINVPTPLVYHGQTIVLLGTVNDTPPWITLCIQGTVAQNFFTALHYTDQHLDSVTATSASADFNVTFSALGFSVWSWQRGLTVPNFDIVRSRDISLT